MQASAPAPLRRVASQRRHHTCAGGENHQRIYSLLITPQPRLLSRVTSALAPPARWAERRGHGEADTSVAQKASEKLLLAVHQRVRVVLTCMCRAASLLSSKKGCLKGAGKRTLRTTFLRLDILETGEIWYLFFYLMALDSAAAAMLCFLVLVDVLVCAAASRTTRIPATQRS